MQLRPLPVILALIVALALLTGMFFLVSNARYSSDAAVRRYIVEHEADVAIECFDPSQPATAVTRNAETPFPLSSTFKLVLLAAYADQVASGALDPTEQIAPAELERYYLPGTDGDAHSQFIAAMGGGRDSFTLDEVVQGMVMYGSNASADYLAARLDPAAVDDLYRRLGLDQLESPFSYLGLYLFTTNHETGAYAEEEISLEDVRAEQLRLEQLYLTDAAWHAEEIAYLHNQANFAPLDIQKAVLGRYGMAGSARDLSRILLAAYGYIDGLPARAQQIVREQLEWPMRVDAANAEQFDVLATQSGAWPGILTSAWYGDPAGEGPPRILVVLYREMPDDYWNAWLVTFSHQELESKVLTTADCSVLLEPVRQ